MADYSGILQTAKEVIASSGGRITIRRLDTSFDLIAPSDSDLSVLQSQVLDAVQLPANKSRTGKFDISSEELKSSSVKYFMVSPGGLVFTPAAGDVVEPITGDPMTIKGVNVLEPDGTILLIEMLATHGAVSYALIDLSHALFLSGEDAYLTTSDGSILTYV